MYPEYALSSRQQPGPRRELREAYLTVESQMDDFLILTLCLG